MKLSLSTIKRNAERLKAEGLRRNEDPEVIGWLCAYSSATWKDAAFAKSLVCATAAGAQPR